MDPESTEIHAEIISSSSLFGKGGQNNISDLLSWIQLACTLKVSEH